MSRQQTLEEGAGKCPGLRHSKEELESVEETDTAGRTSGRSIAEGGVVPLKEQQITPRSVPGSEGGPAGGSLQGASSAEGGVVPLKE